MDTAWIQIFVLTLTECVAPAGKSFCQESEFELQFLTQSECEFALEQLVTLKDASDSVIVEKSKSSCAPSARQQSVYASLAEVAGSVEDKQGWRAPDITEPPPGSTRKVHEARLESLPTCEKTKGVAPCKIGEIIIEDATHQEPVEVWRRD
ncbi:MAG: hypothetical protein ACR2QI_06635 [Woeseiaceae bacterium]